MADFATWDYRRAKQKLDETARKAAGKAFEQNKAFAEDGDHWQRGEGWVGPPSDATERAAMLATIETRFVPVDVIGEAIGRKVDALLKSEARFELVRLDEDDEEEDEAAQEWQDAISAWWDRRSVRLWTKAKKAVRRSCWAGRGGLRLWIPEQRLDEDALGERTLPSAGGIADALALIELAAPQPGAGVLYTDEDTQEQAAILSYVVEDDADAKTNVIELWWVEDEATHLRRLPEAGAAKNFTFDWRGTLPFAEMLAEPLIDAAVRQQQKLANFLSSLLGRTAETAGFPERNYVDIEPPGEWTTDPVVDSPLPPRLVGGVTYHFRPLPLTLGSATTTFAASRITEGSVAGEPDRVTRGQIVYRDPTDPEYITKAFRHVKAVLLAQLKQGHIALDSQAESSGFAYEQARADFIDDLSESAGEADAMLRDLITALIAMAESMSGEKILDTHRVQVSVHVDPGPVSPDRQRADAESVKAGLLARKTAMLRMGIEDVDAESMEIAEQEREALDLTVARAEALEKITLATTIGIEAAARLVGFDDEQVALLTSAPDVETIEQ